MTIAPIPTLSPLERYHLTMALLAIILFFMAYMSTRSHDQ